MIIYPVKKKAEILMCLVWYLILLFPPVTIQLSNHTLFNVVRYVLYLYLVSHQVIIIVLYSYETGIDLSIY